MRLDFPWLWTKAKRAARAVVLFASGIPLLALALPIPLVGEALYGVLSALWAIYWMGVFAYANAPHAWQVDGARDPWFLRVLAPIARVPVLGWPFRFYAWMWRKVTRSVRPACVSFEGGAYEALGLALVRTVVGVPGLYLFFRPLLPAAATHAFLARHELPAPAPLIKKTP